MEEVKLDMVIPPVGVEVLVRDMQVIFLVKYFFINVKKNIFCREQLQQ